MSTDEITKRAVPAAGRSHERRTIFAKKSSAQTTAIAERIALAGRSAFTSVYLRPVMRVLSLRESAYRSNQYATALMRTMRPKRIEI